MSSVAGVYQHSGACHCGTVTYRFTTARPLSDFVPRACDCDFCTAHGATYISDPRGALTLHYHNRAHMYHQGSNTSDFVICPTCGVLTCVLCRVDERLYAVINSRSINGETAPPQTTRLDNQPTEQRLLRRQNTWIGDVVIERAANLDDV